MQTSRVSVQEGVCVQSHYVEVTLRRRVTVEEGEQKTELELADEVATDPGAELTDWDIY